MTFNPTYGTPGEMALVLHEYTGTGFRDIEAMPIKGDNISSLIDKKENKRYIGCSRPKWKEIENSWTKQTDGNYKIEGYICAFAYGTLEYLIFNVIRRA